MFDFPNSPTTGQLLTGANGCTYRWDGSKWVAGGPLPTIVTAFNGRTGAVTMTGGDVNLALGYTPYNQTNPSGYIGDAPNDGQQYARQSLAWSVVAPSGAPINSPNFTGVPTAPTATAGTNTVQLSTCQFVQTAIGNLRAIPYVATTTGQVSNTGATTEFNFAALRIPAGIMGANGVARLEVLWNYTNSSNNKTLQIRYSANNGQIGGGTGNIVGANVVGTTTVAAQTLHILRNNNATNSQLCYGAGASAPYGTSATANTTQTVDTTADSYLSINGTLAVGTETLTLVHACLVVFPHA